MSAYKQEVEARLNHKGCGAAEVFTVGTILVLLTTIHRATSCLVPVQWAGAGLQFLFVCVSLLIPYSGHTSPLTLFTLSAVAIILTVAARRRRQGLLVAMMNRPSLSTASLYVTTYRALLMVSTCFCILAVDFGVLFPPLYMKTETFGISVMDIGVGCFVFSAGYVSRKQWNIASMVPLVGLGLVRIAMVKGVDYPEHVTEYGVHWNFFFTLAAMPVLTNTLFTNLTSSVVACAVYQVLLSVGGLSHYIEHADRSTLFRANREGILSSLGYIVLYHAAKRLRPIIEGSSLVRCWALGGALLMCTVTSDLYLQPYSRRFCNVSYVLFIVTFNVLQLAMLRAVEEALPITLEESVAHDVLLHAINRNSMFVFLIANVLTGGVNVLIHPLHASLGLAVVTMLLYMALVVGVAYIFHVVLNRTMKLW